MLRTPAKILFAIAALIAFHVEAQPVTTYSTLGAGDTYNTGSGWLVNGSANPPQPYVAEAFAFSPAMSGFFTQLRLAVCGGTANISLASNSGANLPGSTLESFLNVSCPGTFGLNNPLVTLNSSANPFLQAGTTYWLCVAASTSNGGATVNQNNLGLLSSQAQAFSPGSWQAKGSKTTFGFDVTVVPEPSAFCLLALFGTAVICRKSHRKVSI